ncbi:MAG: hypothetical protein QMD99_25960 [Rhizobiaceae bacterium]|nr:hypothetical protein [Rhizobiaceae bacterium]
MSRTVRLPTLPTLPTLEPAAEAIIDVAPVLAGFAAACTASILSASAFRQAGRPKDENLKEIKRKPAS